MSRKGLRPGSTSCPCPARPGISSAGSGKQAEALGQSAACVCVMYVSRVCGVCIVYVPRAVVGCGGVGVRVCVCVCVCTLSCTHLSSPASSECWRSLWANSRPFLQSLQSSLSFWAFVLCRNQLLRGPELGRSHRLPRRHLALRAEPIRSLRGSPSFSLPWGPVTVSVAGGSGAGLTEPQVALPDSQPGQRELAGGSALPPEDCPFLLSFFLIFS